MSSRHDDGAELRRIERLLLLKKKQIVGDLSLLEEEALRAEPEEISVDSMADHGTDQFDRAVALDRLQSEEETIRQIDRALEKIHQGKFGTCERCEKPIPKERLRILPHARFCVDCQKESEPAT